MDSDDDDDFAGWGQCGAGVMMPGHEVRPHSTPAEASQSEGESNPDKWLSCQEKKPGASHRLVFFGWTGNRCGRGSDCGPRSPTSWSVLTDFEVHEVVLPGRGSRVSEPCATNVSLLVPEVAVALRTLLMRDEGPTPRPFIFVGFAFGAILAHECAAEMGEYALRTKTTHHICTTEMRETLSKRPLLVVSVCCAGPSWAGRRTEYHRLGDEAFTEELRRRGGTEELLAAPELLDIFLPIVKADVALEETYSPGPRLSAVPVLALFAAKAGPRPGDTLVTEEQARLWLSATAVSFSRAVRLDDFDWFLLETEQGATAVLAEVQQTLSRWGVSL